MSRLIFVFYFFLLLLLIGTGIADAVTVNIKPENPVKGDVVTIYGTAGPNEEVRVDISFEKTVTVRDNRYIFSVDGVKIPEGKNKFTVMAYGCENLKVSVRLFNLIWVTLGSEASNGVATFSQSNVPAGTYNVVIHGKSNKSSVRLKITATGYIKADEKGRFSYSYDTSSLPPGEFTVSVDGITKIVTLETSQSSGSGSSESYPTPTSTPTLTTTLPATTATAIPTPTSLTVTTPTKVVTTTVTILTPTTEIPQQNLTPTQTKTTGEQNGAKTNQISLPFQIPGFEFTIAIISLILVSAYRRLR